MFQILFFLFLTTSNQVLACAGCMDIEEKFIPVAASSEVAQELKVFSHVHRLECQKKQDIWEDEATYTCAIGVWSEVAGDKTLSWSGDIAKTLLHELNSLKVRPIFWDDGEEERLGDEMSVGEVTIKSNLYHVALGVYMGRVSVENQKSGFYLHVLNWWSSPRLEL